MTEHALKVSPRIRRIATKPSHLRMHPHRDALYDELHLRPVVAFSGPMRLTHLAVIGCEHNAGHDHLAALALRYSAPMPSHLQLSYALTTPDFQLRWERHLEHSTYTFLEHSDAPPFSESPMRYLPKAWLETLPGRVLGAIHVATDPWHDGSTVPPTQGFDGHTAIGGSILQGRGSVWTDFRTHHDGFARFLILNRSLSGYQLGRAVQLVLDLEVYRLLALLSWPIAKRLRDHTAKLDEQLADLVERLSSYQDGQEELSLLHEVTRLAARVERIRANTNYRFAATRAYHRLFDERIRDLREHKVAGASKMTQYLARRLPPAMRTCESVEAQLQNLSQRVARAGDLLRTRVDLNLECQSQQLLESMTRNGQLHLSLQRSVEMLSVIAGTYYLVGLLHVAFGALQQGGVPVNADLLSGCAVLPVGAALAWFAYRVRRHLEKRITDDQRARGLGSPEK